MKRSGAIISAVAGLCIVGGCGGATPGCDDVCGSADGTAGDTEPVETEGVDTEGPDDDDDDMPDAGSTEPGPPVDGETLARLRVSNDGDVARVGEIARSGVPLPSSAGVTDVSQLVVADSDGRSVPAQLQAIARWGGAPDDPTLPIMWVAVAAAVDVPAGETTELELIFADAPALEEPLVFVDNVVDTGPAQFTLTPDAPGLFGEINRGGTVVGRAGPLAGPRLVLEDGTVLGAGDVADLRFEVLEDGPLQVVVRQFGRMRGGAATACNAGAGYQSFAYDLQATFVRGSDDVELRLTVRNECGDGFDGPWTDEAFEIREFSFGIPIESVNEVAWVADGELSSAEATSVRVSQRVGGGMPWARRAQVQVDGEARADGSTFARPMAGGVGADFAAGVQLAFMRYREPQAVALRDGALWLSAVSDDLVVGEARGIWNHGTLTLAADGPGLGDDAERGHASLERGLLLHVAVEDLNRAEVFLPLAVDGDATLDRTYVDVMDLLHNATVGEGGQWDRAKTFGSQLWPETVYDRYGIDFADPGQHPSSMNYWNPLGAELYEFFRTGEPRWAWDMGLPAAWLQAHSAYYNVGDQDHTNRSGVAVTSGGSGIGHWHRSEQGSDDYTYCWGLKLAYLIRPEPALLDRFRQAGLAMAERYGVEDEGARELYVNERGVSRQVMQHMEMLLNCAQFVPGAEGDVCRDSIHEIMEEFARDNLSAGVMCSEDRPANPCFTPQQFMQASFMFEVFTRYELTFPGRISGLRENLVRIGSNYAEYGLPRDGAGNIDVTGEFGTGMECELTADRDSVTSCTPAPNSDGLTAQYQENHAHSLAMVYMADQLDPSRARCDELRTAMDDPALEGMMRSWADEGGYWKGANQTLQGLVFAVGSQDTCP